MQTEFFKNPHLRQGIIIFLVLTSLLIFFSYWFREEQPAVYNPSDLNPALVDRSLQDMNANHKIGPFSLINQNGDTITEKNYEGKIYVADFFFTRCPTICPVMTNNMEKLQTEFLNDADVKLLSLSVTPEYDSVPVLYNYASKNGALDTKWNITTGSKRHIYELARKNYFAVVDQGDGGLQDFIHTPNFVLVDKEKQIRGIYDGTKDQEITRLIKDIRILQQ
ncbi:MAG: SCO family protein [Eudoraea sp.]|nr:SCO family protein [Eudoraea sp.]